MNENQLTETEKRALRTAAQHFADGGSFPLCMLERHAEGLLDLADADAMAQAFYSAYMENQSETDTPLVRDMRQVADFMRGELSRMMDDAELVSAGVAAIRERRTELWIIPQSGNGERNTPPPLKIYGEFLQGLLDAEPNELAAIMCPLIRWHIGLDYTRPTGLAGMAFDAIQAAAERAEKHRAENAEKGRKGGQAASERKAVAVRENGRKGGRPKAEPKPNLSQTKAKPKHDTDNDNDNDNDNDKIKTDTEPKGGTGGAVSDSVSDLDLDLGKITDAELIRRAARSIGESKPSDTRWTRFIERFGKRVFRDVVHELCEELREGKKKIVKTGAYLNAMLDRYEREHSEGQFLRELLMHTQ